MDLFSKCRSIFRNERLIIPHDFRQGCGDDRLATTEVFVQFNRRGSQCDVVDAKGNHRHIETPDVMEQVGIWLLTQPVNIWQVKNAAFVECAVVVDTKQDEFKIRQAFGGFL